MLLLQTSVLNRRDKVYSHATQMTQDKPLPAGLGLGTANIPLLGGLGLHSANSTLPAGFSLRSATSPDLSAALGMHSAG
jgi:hypothetical protein